MAAQVRGRVCILTSVHKPFDDRIFHKQAVTLARAGYAVALVAPHDVATTVDGVRLEPIPPTSGRLSRVTLAQARVLRLALQARADVYHFHDPELIGVGLVLKALGKTVIYDVHELVYHQIADKGWIRWKALRKVAQWTYRRFETAAVRVFDALILAEDDYLRYFEAAYGASSKYTIIRNSPIRALIDAAPPAPRDSEGKPVVIYAGGLTRHRGIRELVEAVGLLKGRVNLQLLGDWESAEFREECEHANGWVYTSYLGYRPLREVYSLMKAADVGVSVLHPIKNYLTSLPIKVFEYMAAPLPAVVSDFPYWRGIFDQCALFADPERPESLAAAIVEILERPNATADMVRRGCALIEREYNWEREAAKLLHVYQSLTT